MSEGTWEAILDELASVQYSGRFAFHNYNEPLADPTIFAKIARARKTLDRATLTIFTNGDYLDAETFGHLASLGVNHVRINLYPPNTLPLSQPRAERIIRYLSTVLGVHVSESEVFLDQHLQAIVSINSVEVHLMAPLVQYYHNRGGAVRLEQLNSQPQRPMPCFLPYLSAAIDYRGNLKLCCEIYDATLPENSAYLIGNISDGGFMRWWFSDRMNGLRNLVGTARFAQLPACRSCRYLLDEKQLAGLSICQ